MNALNKQIEQAIRQHKEALRVRNGATETDVRHAVRWVMRDNPDIFWFVHQYHFDKDKGIVSFRYRCSLERSVLIQGSIDDVVENDFQISYVRKMSQLEQVAYVYKWLLTYCNYNVNSAYNQNIDSVFVRRNSVCTGYAKAAQYLFDLLGIESRLVFGRLHIDKKNGRHCWNIVRVEGCYYHLDVCLGDKKLANILRASGIMAIWGVGNLSYNCFCVSTNEIAKTRSIEDVNDIPSCNKNLSSKEVIALSRLVVNRREEIVGCLMSQIGSSADIYACTKDKNVVLKKFRANNAHKCKEEYAYMRKLKGCDHLIQLNDTYSDIVVGDVIAIEQSTPIVDLFCSHYYHPSLYGILKMIRDVTLGWIECYKRGILYRDIHVCNIYKANDGRYKLGDFGSCVFYNHGLRERVGNPWFMSPETYITGQFDERSAVYSITSVLYFVLNGLRPPFVDSNNEEVALQHKLNGETMPVPLLLRFIPKQVAEMIMEKLILRGCAYYPSQRLPSCKELLHVLNNLHSTLPNHRIELHLSYRDSEALPAIETLPYAHISRDVRHRFAFGEEAERRATTSDPYLFFTYNKKDDEAWNDVPDGLNETDGAVAEYDFASISILMSDDVEIFCRTMGYDSSSRGDDEESLSSGQNKAISYTNPRIRQSIKVFFNRLIHERAKLVYGSLFAPAEIKIESPMIVQLYLHQYKETEIVKLLARESDKNAERRDYIPLQCKLNKGDKVDVQMNIYGETLLMSDRKSVVWHGSFTKCSFDYFVPKDIGVDELCCVVILTVNGIPVGEMRFITKIVDSPRQLNPQILAHKYKKVFISYSHQDESKVKFLHEGLELGAVPHFFDRKYLKTGDVFPQVIQDYINSADLFILCWSENASKSEYVQKERLQALERAFPQVQPEKEAKLRIYPMSIEPRAELPGDMKDSYHFGEI